MSTGHKFDSYRADRKHDSNNKMQQDKLSTKAPVTIIAYKGFQNFMSTASSSSSSPASGQFSRFKA